MSTVGLDEDEIRKYVRRQLEKDWFADQLNLWQGQVPSRVAQPTPPPLGVIVDLSGPQDLAQLGCEYFGMYKVFRA